MNSLPKFTLTQIEYALALQKQGHFAKAARDCHVTQPTLSMQIQKLEDELGQVLFDRSKKPLLVTEAGKPILAQMQNLLFEAKKLERVAQSFRGAEPGGELHLGVIPTIAPYVLPRLLPVLKKNYAGLRLLIREMQTQKIIEALDADEIDVGLLATPLKIPRILEFPLYYEPFAVFCRREHELARRARVRQESLKQHDIWLLEEGHCLRGQILNVCSRHEASESRRFSFESGSLETLKKLVSQFEGYTLLPWLAWDQIPRATRIVEFERPIPARQIGLVHRREHYKSELIEALGEGILAAIPEALRKIRPKDLDVLEI